MATIPRPILYAMAGLLASQLALATASTYVAVSKTEQVEQEDKAARQQWCSTLRVFKDSYADNPPATRAGQDFRDGLAKVYNAYHCDQVKEP